MPIPVDLDGSAASIKRSIDRSWANYDMADGETVKFNNPRDFGWAVCDDRVCVRKTEIRGVHFSEAQLSLSPEKLLLAPAIIVGLGLIQPTVGGDGRVHERTAADDLPECATHRDPAPPEAALASQKALTEWVWSNQKSLSAACLRRAVGILASDEARAVRLNMLASAKLEWNRLHCRSWRGVVYKLAPSGGYRKGPGDPLWLAWIDEMIADLETLNATLDEDTCANLGGIAPESEWEARKPEVLWKLNPFNRGPFSGADRADDTTQPSVSAP